MCHFESAGTAIGPQQDFHRQEEKGAPSLGPIRKGPIPRAPPFAPAGTPHNVGAGVSDGYAACTVEPTAATEPSGEQPGARTSDARIRGASHSAFKGGRAEERAFAHHLAVTAFVVVDRAFSVRGRESAVIGVKQERTREHLCIMHKCPFARCDACSPVAIARKTGTVNSSRGGSP